ncbi:MAG: hypothetical protein J0I20_16350 [Chloroflexi bacterium]|nr:hypothetical protein [Chloroflexota bacterium]OJV88719.1 MAG: hypothetical protein BGO39_04240 [Chloroflexi bacterium 54-19]
MDNRENLSIEPVPEPVKVYEGEVIEKTATWEDVRRSWSELRQTWVIGLERIKAAMEERARLRNAARENTPNDHLTETTPD